jgi:signal peptidase I
MLPNIEPGSRVVVDKLYYRSAALRRGDLVVFTNPNVRHAKYIKRVVALPGDVVEMQNDELIVNGQRLDHGNAPRAGTERVEGNAEAQYRIRLGPVDSPKSGITSFEAQRIPNGQCFVLGDNRHQSDDSRVHGPVPLMDVVGRVARVF